MRRGTIVPASWPWQYHSSTVLVAAGGEKEKARGVSKGASPCEQEMTRVDRTCSPGIKRRYVRQWGVH